MLFLIRTAGDTGKQDAEQKRELAEKEELKAERGRTGFVGTVSESQCSPPGEDEGPSSACSSSTAKPRQESSALRLVSPTIALDKPPSIQERAAALSQTLEKPSITPMSQKKSPSIAPVFPQAIEKLLVSPPAQEKTPSTIPGEPTNPEIPREKKGSGTAPSTADVRQSTQERVEATSKQYTMKAEPADHRTEPPGSE